MRTSLLTLALLIAAPAVAAAPAPPSLAIVSAVEVDGVPVIEGDARVHVHTPLVMMASFALHSADGQAVRVFEDRLLWDGESVVMLDVGNLPAGSYRLVVTSRIGTLATPLLIA